MVKQISVIVCCCNETGKRIYADDSTSFIFPADMLDEALSFAKDQIGKLKCVIVRPNYNELHQVSLREYYREWRSYNGEELKEETWDI